MKQFLSSAGLDAVRQAVARRFVEPNTRFVEKRCVVF